MLGNKKRTILFFISLIGIVIVSLMLVSTYAYQSVQTDFAEGSNNNIGGNDGINTAKLDVSFTTSEYINLSNIPLLPEYITADYIEMTIDNTKSTTEIGYSITLTDLEYNTSLAHEVFKYNIVSVTDTGLEEIGSGNFSNLTGTEFTFNLSTNTYDYIESGKTKKVRIYLWLDSNVDTPDITNTSFKGKVTVTSLFKENAPHYINGTNNLELSQGKLISNYRIYGNSLQNGTPTPDTPIEIESVGDKTSNLLNPARDTFTHAGVIFTKHEDGTYTLNGTATSTTDVYLVRTSDTDSHIPVYSGKYYKISRKVISGSYSGKYNINASTYNGSSLVKWGWLMDTGGAKTPDIDCAIKAVVFYMQTGAVFNNFRIGIQIEEVESESSTGTEFEPYGYRIPVTVRGKNYIMPNDEGTRTINGVTIESDGKGNYHLYGTATALTSYRLNANNGLVIPSGKYRMTGAEKGDISTSYFWRISTDLRNSDQAGKEAIITYDTDNTINYVMIYVREGVTIDTIITPRLELYDTAPITTTNIYLNEPLRKIGEYTDYIDFQNKKVIRNTETITYDGSSDESWSKYGQNETYYGYMTYNDLAPKVTGQKNCFCNRVESLIGYGSIWYGRSLGCFIGNTNGSKAAFVITSDKTTIQDFRSYLSTNPLDVVFALKTKKEETIELPEITSDTSTNRIFEVGTSVSPSNIEILVSE